MTSLTNGAFLPPPPPVDDIAPLPPAELPPPPTDDVAPPPPVDLPPPPPPETEDEPLAPAVKPKKKSGWGSTTKTQPVSVEELIQRKKAAEEAAAKPKFLTKAQREKLALERRQKEFREQNGTIVGQAERTNGSGTINGNSSANGHHVSRTAPSSAIPTGPRAMRSNESAARPPPPSDVRYDARADENSSKKRPYEDVQAKLIRERYMGADQQQSTFSALKKRKKTTEKKFNFEWNAEEDTSPAHDPLYNSRKEVSFFGKGRLGGFSDDKIDAAAYARILEQRDPVNGKRRAAEFLEMERRRREEASRTAIEKHWSEKRLDQMRERDWRIFKEDFNISTKGGAIPNPMRSWAESGLPSDILKIVEDVGYAEPSAVQRAAIPIALQSRDLIGVAVTGSGKTAAFLLPLLVYIKSLPPLRKEDGPYAIVLAPTRELAQQIEVEARKFAHPLGFSVVSIVGGHNIEEQVQALSNGAEIIIATPGRLVDCLERKVLILGQCCYIVMDEADRMVDMGFEEPVNKILDALPVSNQKPDTDAAEDARAMRGYRQTMMFSATMPTAVRRIAEKYLRRPATVTIGTAGEAVETVEQRVEFVGGEDKRKKRIAEILASRQFAPPIIVFVNIKANCDAVAKDIRRMGYSTVTLHGSKTQDQREAALASVRRGETEILVATDLAGRGLDVPDVSLVINFNMSKSIESYTHRIGRTGRAGKSGVAITFLGPEDNDVLYDLKQMLSKSSISKVPEELRKHEAAQQRRGGQKKIDQ